MSFINNKIIQSYEKKHTQKEEVKGRKGRSLSGKQITYHGVILKFKLK